MRGDSDIKTTHLIWIIGKISLSLRSFKTGHLSADNFKKFSTSMGRHLSPRCGQVILVSDALFWQLSVDHNIDVQLVFSWAAKLARKCESKHWFPCVCGRTVGGRSVYGHVITKFSGMGSGALLLFCRNFRCNLTYYESDNFSNSSLLHIFESEFFFVRKIA